MIIAGDNHTFIIDSNNQVLACGQNGSGQLGLSNNVITTSFEVVLTDLIPSKNVTIDGRSLIKPIAVGGEHSIMITEGDRVAVCGTNYTGQLGLDSATSTLNRFTILPDIKNCKMASCGINTSVILTHDGTILISGVGIIGGLSKQLVEFTNCNYLFDVDDPDNSEDNEFYGNWIGVFDGNILVIDTIGRLWHSSIDIRPTIIHSGIGAVEACMLNQSIIIRNSSGEVFQYIIGDDRQDSEPIVNEVICMECTSNRIFARCNDGRVIIIAPDVVTTLDIDDITVERIGASDNSLFIYTTDGTLLSRGVDYSGQLGLGIDSYEKEVDTLTIVDIPVEDIEEVEEPIEDVEELELGQSEDLTNISGLYDLE